MKLLISILLLLIPYSFNYTERIDLTVMEIIDLNPDFLEWDYVTQDKVKEIFKNNRYMK